MYLFNMLAHLVEEVQVLTSNLSNLNTLYHYIMAHNTLCIIFLIITGIKYVVDYRPYYQNPF